MWRLLTMEGFLPRVRSCLSRDQPPTCGMDFFDLNRLSVVLVLELQTPREPPFESYGALVTYLSRRLKTKTAFASPAPFSRTWRHRHALPLEVRQEFRARNLRGGDAWRERRGARRTVANTSSTSTASISSTRSYSATFDLMNRPSAFSNRHRPSPNDPPSDTVEATAPPPPPPRRRRRRPASGSKKSGGNAAPAAHARASSRVMYSLGPGFIPCFASSRSSCAELARANEGARGEASKASPSLCALRRDAATSATSSSSPRPRFPSSRLPRLRRLRIRDGDRHHRRFTRFAF